MPTLHVFLDASAVEEGGTVTGRVERNWITASSLSVTFSASIAGQFNLPTVVIPANQTSATFTLATIQNTLPEKNEVVIVTAQAGGNG